MTVAQFRRLALSFPDSVEASHMNHPDFRVGGKIFATLGYPDNGWGMVKLPRRQQTALVSAEPEVFVPARGKWGLQGATMVCLKKADANIVRDALFNAWCHTAPKSLVRQAKDRLLE